MESVEENLNYNFNILLHYFHNCLHNCARSSDKFLAVAWVNKLKNEMNSLEETQLRNDLLFYLIKSVECGCLKSPFDQKPPRGRLLNIRSILPPEMKSQVDSRRSTTQPKPEIFERSPDKGAFLAAQPVPRSGVFCYLAIASRAADCD